MAELIHVAIAILETVEAAAMWTPYRRVLLPPFSFTDRRGSIQAHPQILIGSAVACYPQCAEDLPNDEADLSYLGDGLFGRDKVDDSPKIIGNRMVRRKKTMIDVRRWGNLRRPSTAMTIPASGGAAGDAKDSTEYELLISTADQGKWDECVVEAEEWVKKMFPESESDR